MVLGKWHIHMQKSEIVPYLTPCTRINSKWIKHLKVRPETVTPRRKCCDIDLSNYFMDTKAQETKVKIDSRTALNYKALALQRK